MATNYFGLLANKRRNLMAFQVSPGVLVQEKDLTRIIPAVSTSTGAFAGTFRKGPLDEVVTISSEQELVSVFGKPDAGNFEDFFSAANFLQYSNALRVVRVQNSSVSNATESGSSFVIKNLDDYTTNYADGSASVGQWAARTAGAHGNSIAVHVCPSATAYEQSNVTTVNDSATAAGDTVVTVTSGTGINVGDIVNFGDNYEYRVIAVNTNDLTIVRKDEPAHFTASDSSGLFAAITDGAQVRRRWKYYDLVRKAPGTSSYTSKAGGSGDEMHIVVVDEDGDISEKGAVLEVFDAVSKASDAKLAQGETNYYPTVIQNKSNYIFWMDHNAGGSNWGNAASGTTYTAVNTPTSESLSGGSNGSTVTTGQLKEWNVKYHKLIDRTFHNESTIKLTLEKKTISYSPGQIFSIGIKRYFHIQQGFYDSELCNGTTSFVGI